MSASIVESKRIVCIKKEFEYEEKPPICHACVHVAVIKNKGKQKNTPKQFFCFKGKFKTKYYSNCKHWLSKIGETSY